MDFYKIKEREASQRKGILEIYPDFQVMRSKDLMIRAKSFYAIWDDEKGLWSTDEFDVQRLVDADIKTYAVQTPGIFEQHRKYLGNFSTSSWMQFRHYVSNLSDNHHELDSRLTFRNSDVKKEDYVSRRLPYDLSEGDISAWDTLVGTLYDPPERAKIEWAIGAIVAGDSITIQKFLVFYGSAGTGKSTVLNIIQWLFEGYWNSFVARDLVSSNNAFALEGFKNNPLVAIEHDGDLSRVQDNSKLNSLVAHEPMEINEKNKPKYVTRFNAMLMIGSNAPVKITDSRSGLIRRLIDVHPTGNLIPPRKYQSLINQVKFELGAIAWHCREVYLSMGKDYYAGYKPIEMMLQTDVFFNFIESNYDVFEQQDGVTLNQAYEMYKVFIDESGIDHKLPRYKLRDELRNYFDEFEERAVVDDVRVRSWYSGFKADRFKTPTMKKEEKVFSLVMEETESLFDRDFSEFPAQYAKEDGTPRKYWTNEERQDKDGKMFIPKKDQVVDTKLSDLDTSKEHYVKVPVNHIVIDFDLRGADGEKSAELNLEKAASWPPTYAEFSKSGGGIHLHYNYTGDPEELSRLYEEGIEVKVYTGNSSLRRALSRCNNVPVANLNPGVLPLKEKKVIDADQVASELGLRKLIDRNLKKEIHPSTKSSMDFIKKILDDAYQSGLSYDVTDMREKIMVFASGSSNQALQCLKIVTQLQLKSEDVIEQMTTLPPEEELVFYDVEVFPNLFIISWKFRGARDVVRLVNPSPHEVENLMQFKLVGFNVRRYDNHILYGAMMGMNNEQLYNLSQKIISNAPGAQFGAAYNISYADIYDFSSKKQSLKKFQIELGLNHQELGLPWDKPVAKELWEKVGEYCDNDVITTEQVFDAREQDFVARQILSDLSGLPVNSSTQQHTARIVFGEDKKPQEKFVYTDLSELFPGYEYELGKSTYRGEVTGEGGYVYAEPGMYENVALLDVESMHPTSIETLDLFGEYTKNFSELKQARLAIKRGEFEEAKKMLGGKLTRYLKDVDQAEALGYALKIVINIVYGLTSARFDNAFRDPRNIDNIVAKRGALFMIELKHYVQNLGYQVVHIKTDSIKIPNADKKIIDLVMEFGKEYGYTFDHEATYEKFCLVNDAVYIAKTKPGKKPAHWVATGAQFAHPVVFKTLFDKSKPLEFSDFTETKTVTSALYLDMTPEDLPMAADDGDYMQFIGKAGAFVPIMPDHGGGYLMREKDGKFYAATGTKGYRWLEAEMVKTLNKQDFIDKAYYDKLVNEAIESVSKYGDFSWFVDE